MAWQTVEAQTQQPNEILAQSTAAAFMAGVYRWMFAGLFLTSGVALYTATNRALLNMVIQGRWVLIIAQFGLVLALSGMASRLSGAVAGAMFLLYSALTGLTFSVLFLVYEPRALVQAFALTGGVYGVMSLYGTMTKKDLSGWASFLFMGLIGVVIASVIQIFTHSSILSFVTSCASVVVFAGLTAYDNQKLRAMHASSGYSSALSLTVVGALTLYLDFINLFLAMLRLFGDRRR